MQTAPPGETASYYDSNTARFLRGQSRGVKTIHRALYAPGVRTRSEALHYSHSLVLAELRRLPSHRVLDLGCGVGASLLYLQSHLPELEYVGITISQVQAEMARTQGLPVELWDYHQPSWFEAQSAFDVVYAIESLQHAADLDAVVRNVHRVCAQVGRVVVIDDFQTDGPVPLGRQRLFDRYIKHWHAHGYRRRDEFVRTMESGGFRWEYSQDLGAYQRSRPWYNRLVYGVLSPLQHLNPVPSYAQNLLGGNALLRLQDLGLSGYQLLVFTRV